MGSYPEAFPVSGCCRNDVFWVHNLKLSLGRMRAVSSRGTSINGTPSSSQATVLKDFPSGLQNRCSGHELFWVCVRSAERRGRSLKP